MGKEKDLLVTTSLEHIPLAISLCTDNGKVRQTRSTTVVPGLNSLYFSFIYDESLAYNIRGSSAKL